MTEQMKSDENSLVKVFGRSGTAEGYKIRDFLQRCDIPFQWIELASDEEAHARAGVQGLADSRLPVCVFPDGSRMDCPTIRQITQKLGWFAAPQRAEYDLAIYGAGPAGLSAAVYGGSEGLRTILVEKWAVGGQAGSSSRIENYLGFPDGISGADLAERAREQAQKFGVEILIAREAIRAEFPPGKRIGYLEDGTRLVSHAAICATGVDYRRLGLPDEERFLGAGVYYGAGASEASLTEGQDIFIVGGGNSAGHAAMHFTRFARSIHLLIRGDSLADTLSQYLVDRIRSTASIEILTRTEVVGLHGDRVLEEITVADRRTGKTRTENARWLFICIGGASHTDWADAVGVVRNRAGYVLTGPDLARGDERPANWPLERRPYFLETSVPGVFAASDVRHGAIKRVASAVGEGAMAVTLVHRFLTEDD